MTIIKTDIGGQVFYSQKKPRGGEFLPPTLQTPAEILVGFPGISGPGGCVLGSSPSNLGNFLFPKYNIKGVPFSVLKYWGSGSYIENDARKYRRQFRKDESPKISFKMRVDPWGYFLWGGHPLDVGQDFPFMRADLRAESRTIFTAQELEDDPDLVKEEVPELIYTLANKGRSAVDVYDQVGETLISDLTLSIIVGQPAQAVATVCMTELEFCQTLPDVDAGEKVKKHIKHNTSLGSGSSSQISYQAYSEPYKDTINSKDDPSKRDDVFVLEFTLDPSLINTSAELVEITFLLNVGGQMTTIPEVLFVGKDKTKLKDQESVDIEESVPGPMSWSPCTTVYPIVEGTHPRDVTKDFLENRPNQIENWNESVAQSGRI